MIDNEDNRRQKSLFDKKNISCFDDILTRTDHPAFILDSTQTVICANQKACELAAIEKADFGFFSFSNILVSGNEAYPTAAVLRDGFDISRKAIVTRRAGMSEAETVCCKLDEDIVLILVLEIQKKRENDCGELNDCLKHFTAFAHDCNNMLGAISGYADLIKNSNRNEDGTARDTQLEKRISMILHASVRASEQMNAVKKTLKQCMQRYS